MKLIDHLPLDVLYHHFEVLILLLGLLLLAHWLMLNHLVLGSTATTSWPHSDVFTHEIITIFILTVLDEAVTTAAYVARIIRAEEGVLDGSTT